MSFYKLFEANPQQGKISKISPDGKKISVQTGPGQTMNLDLDKDPNIDVSSNGGKTSIKLNHDNKNKLKKPGGAKPGQTVSIESKKINERDIGLLKAVAQQMEADAHAGDYTAIEELLQGVSEEELKGFLSDHRSPNEWPDESVKEAEVTVDNAGNIAGYLATIDEYVEMLFKSAKGTAKDVSLSKESATTIAYRIQNAVDDIRTRELGLKPSNIRAKFNENFKKKD
jgi:hypothetical protein